MRGFGRKEMEMLEVPQEEEAVVVEVEEEAKEQGEGKKVVHAEEVGEQGNHIQEVDVMRMMTVGASHDGGGKMRKTAQEPIVDVGFTKVGVRMTRMTTFLNGNDTVYPSLEKHSWWVVFQFQFIYLYCQ